MAQNNLAIQHYHNCIVLGHHDQGILFTFNEFYLIDVFVKKLLFGDAPEKWQSMQVFGEEL